MNTKLRRLAGVTAIALTGLTLAVLLNSLHELFVEERKEALATLREQRAGKADLARRILRELLGDELARAMPRMRAAILDPLVDASGLLLVDHGEIVLPRSLSNAPGDDLAGKALYERLSTRGETPPNAATSQQEDDAPWQTRVALGARFLEAIEAGETKKITATFREILRHSARYELAATREIPFWIAHLEAFVGESRPDATLMKNLLRSGLAIGPGFSIEGLQRRLLRSRDRFSHADFLFLAERIVALSARVDVRNDDFSARIAEAGVVPPAGVAELAAPSLLDAAGWYAAPAANGQIRGISLAGDVALLAQLTEEMRSKSLIAHDEELEIAVLSPGVTPLADVQLGLDSPRWSTRVAVIEHRYTGKTALALSCAALVLGITGLAGLAQYRKSRILKLRSEFIAAVSHELRTPLASVRLQAETLQRRLDDPEAARTYAERIVRDIDGLDFMVENILSFNRLERGGWVPDKAPLRLADLVTVVREELRPAELASFRLEVQGDPEVSLFADAELFKLLLLNLIRNACQYTRRRPVQIQISALGGDPARIVVRDNGRGIPRERWETVFADFYREPEAAGTRGSGLGLALVRRIARAHGGDVRIADSGASGTAFELWVPSAA